MASSASRATIDAGRLHEAAEQVFAILPQQHVWSRPLLFEFSFDSKDSEPTLDLRKYQDEPDKVLRPDGKLMRGGNNASKRIRRHSANLN